MHFEYLTWYAIWVPRMVSVRAIDETMVRRVLALCSQDDLIYQNMRIAPRYELQKK